MLLLTKFQLSYILCACRLRILTETGLLPQEAIEPPGSNERTIIPLTLMNGLHTKKVSPRRGWREGRGGWKRPPCGYRQVSTHKFTSLTPFFFSLPTSPLLRWIRCSSFYSRDMICPDAFYGAFSLTLTQTKSEWNGIRQLVLGHERVSHLYVSNVEVCDCYCCSVRCDSCLLRIIHPCCHPEDKIAPTTEDEMILEVCKFVETQRLCWHGVCFRSSNISTGYSRSSVLANWCEITQSFSDV